MVLFLFLSTQLTAWSQQPDSVQLHDMVQKYCRSINDADSILASSLWEHGNNVSFINPRGHEVGLDNIKKNIYHFFWTYFSKRDLRSIKERYSIYDDIAIVEFYWIFDAVLKANNAPIQTKGRETQIWRKSHNEWKLVHIHYSGMPVTGQEQGF
jgi:hypothetical protein